ncbi:hypothetical protein HK099_004737, partial [Clydaea vesicula]
KAYRIRKAIIRANSPSASVKANPSIAEENSSCFYEGFLEVPVTRAAKIKPTPTAAPPNAIVAKPAPINLAAIYIFISYLLSIPNLSMINPYKCTLILFYLKWFIPKKLFLSMLLYLSIYPVSLLIK